MISDSARLLVVDKDAFALIEEVIRGGARCGTCTGIMEVMIAVPKR